jgi:hypothetical protein
MEHVSLKRKGNQKYQHNYDAFFNEDAISYYLLGAYYTDGTVFKNGASFSNQINSCDKDWLEIIRDIISPCSPVTAVCKSRPNYYRLRLSDKTISEWLISKGCIINKTLCIQFPHIPSQYLPDFIRGCMDGDGSMGIYERKNKNRNKTYLQSTCYLLSASKSFITDIILSLQDLGFTCHYKEKKVNTMKITILKDGHKIIPKHDQHFIVFTSRFCKEFLQWCYYPNHKLSMPRKSKIAERIILQ